MVLENILQNFSFFALLVSMLFFWFQIAFFPSSSSSSSSNTTSLLQWDIGNFGIFLANLSLFFLLLLRWKNSGHFPLSNLYESLIFLSWACTFLHILLKNGFRSSYKSFEEETRKSEGESAESESQTTASLSQRWAIIGSIISPIALFTNAFATFSLPEEMQKMSPLVPALQSNWLMMHVTVMILSYAALILGSLFSIAFLILSGFSGLFSLLPLRDKSATESLDVSGLAPSFREKSPTASIASLSPLEARLPLRSFDKIQKENYLLKILDNLSYRILGIGFPLLTVGILSGAVWANEAWGSYWSWDPKETWALLTWLVFAIYLHTRLIKGWQGQKPAIIASLGFIVVWICYLGVNLIGEGLHSYGWIKI